MLPLAPTDSRTTPPGQRPLVLFALASAIAFFAWCYVANFMRGGSDWATLGQWSMFTEADPWHHDLVATAYYGKESAELDLAALFPSQWDSGPRYVRGPFRNDEDRLSVLIYSACQRARPTPTAILIEDERWRALPGRPAEPREGSERRKVLRQSCASDVDLPRGERL